MDVRKEVVLKGKPRTSLVVQWLGNLPCNNAGVPFPGDPSSIVANAFYIFFLYIEINW